MGCERFSEVDGLRAVWRMTRNPHGRIEIRAVHDTNGTASRTTHFAAGTDLASARERHPRWNRLWDTIQHEFWADIAAVTGPSATPRPHDRT